MSEDLNYIYKVIRRTLNIILIIFGTYIGIKMAIFYMPFLIAFILSLLIEPIIRFLMKHSCGMRWISTMSISAKAISISAGNGRAVICASRSSPMPRAYIRSPCRNSIVTVSCSNTPTAPSISAR